MNWPEFTVWWCVPAATYLYTRRALRRAAWRISLARRPRHNDERSGYG
jgi:hypothetical protein